VQIVIDLSTGTCPAQSHITKPKPERHTCNRFGGETQYLPELDHAAEPAHGFWRRASPRLLISTNAARSVRYHYPEHVLRHVTQFPWESRLTRERMTSTDSTSPDRVAHDAGGKIN
jgi:hypothetical protein